MTIKKEEKSQFMLISENNDWSQQVASDNRNHNKNSSVLEQTICNDSNNLSIPVITSKTNASIQLSFQLMTRAEPVEMVITSIKSLLAIKAPADEILIIDNNHTDIALYEPLQAFCAGLDKSLNVHFYHVDTVAGFKAGALNLALELMDSACSHIVVVDSDYQALPQARISIVTAIERYPNHALLQFPQFYRDAGREEVHSELNHYFNYHLYRPFNRQRALSTGTYAVICRTALLQLGGWSGASITEDAQMGVLMHRQGLRSQFIPEVIATGLLPNTLSDLMSQRRRWIYGNMQVFSRYFASHSSSLDSPSITRASERFTYLRAHFSQLSAWVNFTGIFILLHAFSLLIIAAALVMSSRINLSTLLLPLYIVYGAYTVFLGRRLWAYLHDSAPLSLQPNGLETFNVKVESSQTRNIATLSTSKKIRTWLMHINFWELGALSWLPVLWGRDKPFICTPKFEVVRSERTLWLENILALPKLLLVLNVVTAIIVAPFSTLYSPLLFVCALSVCLLKLKAATVVFANYAYKDPSVKPSIKTSIAAKSLIATKQAPIKIRQNNTVLSRQSMSKQPVNKQQTLTTAKIDNNKTMNS